MALVRLISPTGEECVATDSGVESLKKDHGYKDAPKRKAPAKKAAEADAAAADDKD